jgi:pantetheine-phosphate adenylyltransferase
MRIAVYAGSFDPMTNGHLNVVRRALQLFDRLIVGVVRRREKNTMFSLEERVALAKKATTGIKRVKVVGFDGLLVDYARKNGARAIVRGLRAVVDFDYEFQMALTNRRIAPDIEIVFFLPSEQYFYISSSLVKEIARLGGKISAFVPKAVEAAVVNKIKSEKRKQ